MNPDMSTIFQVHSLTPAQKKQAAAFIQSYKYTQLTSQQQLSIAVFGDKQSGKTTCALDLVQCPFTELPPSLCSSVIQTVVQTLNHQTLCLTVHDSTEFILANTVLLLINAMKPESAVYLKQFISQLHESQLVFILINKCDQCSKEQFIQAVNSALDLQHLIQSKNNVQLLPTMLKDNFSQPQLLNIISLSVQNMRYQNAKAELLRSQKEFHSNLQLNEKLFTERLNGSLEKRGLPIIKPVTSHPQSENGTVIINSGISSSGTITTHPEKENGNSYVQNNERENGRKFKQLVEVENEFKVVADEEEVEKNIVGLGDAPQFGFNAQSSFNINPNQIIINNQNNNQIQIIQNDNQNNKNVFQIETEVEQVVEKKSVFMIQNDEQINEEIKPVEEEVTITIPKLDEDFTIEAHELQQIQVEPVEEEKVEEQQEVVNTPKKKNNNKNKRK
ncbi:Conserved_hypothetical protein [Hexamita inflata]|uniref:Uncharacterized protein n=1 Tax=Hexamita inflata TaxID=28002 RepID=A0AA86PWT7_9EUKA|nr:Conserved hypothetical protein [Hexamita inflata]